MNINVYSYPEGIDFRKIETRIAHKSKMKYLYSLDMNLTTEGRYYKKVKKYLITFPQELNSILEQLMEREVEENRLSHLGIKQSDETKLKKSRTVSNLIWVADGVNNKRIPSNQIIPEGFYKGRIYTENGIKSMKDKLHKRMLGNTYGKGKKGKDSPSYKEISKEIIDSIMSDFKYIKDGIMYYNITLYLFNRAYKEYYGHKFKDRYKIME